MSVKEEIKVAQTAGFCWGVKRAMDMTLETARTANGVVYTHGPLIHNPQVIEMLEGKNVFAVDDATKLDGCRVIIRTHGVTPDVRRELKERGLDIEDATCPLVARVQGIIKKHANRGFHTVMIGDAGHAEVVGLTGYTRGRGHVVGSVEEVAGLPPMDKVCVVAQTTCDQARYDSIVAAIRERFPGAVVADTICDATRERQTEVLEMAGQVDLMVVVGGRNSANTSRLAQLAREAGAEAALIESEEDLDPDIIRRYPRIGLTAGASTPSWMIQRVFDRLKTVTCEAPSPVEAALRRMMATLTVSNASVALGAALMVFANATLGQYPFTWLGAYVAAAYIFTMYALNQLNDVETLRHNEPDKIRFYLKNRRAVIAAAAVGTVSSLAAVFALGMWSSVVYIGALALGLAYTVKWFPKSDVIRIHRLKDLPASKDVFVGVAWAAVTVIIPALGVGADPMAAPVGVALAFTFIIVYIRSVLSDIRDIHGDRVVGRETIPILIGKPATKKFLAALTFGLAGLLTGASAFGWAPPFGYLLLISVGYTAMYLALYHRRIISRGAPFDMTIDGVFHVTGALAIAWTLA